MKQPTRAEVEYAAFRDEAICLDCGAEGKADEDGDCPECGGQNVVEGKTALRMASLVEAWGDEE